MAIDGGTHLWSDLLRGGQVVLPARSELFGAPFRRRWHVTLPVMGPLPRTRLAVLSTISELHREPLAYDLACLRALVADIAPDLLCVEITREAWENGNFTSAPVEVSGALVPVEASTDVVIIPVASTNQAYADFIPAEPGRRSLTRTFDRLLRWGQRKANRPEAIHGLLFGSFCHTLCWLTEATWTTALRAAWAAQNQAMAENIWQAAQRDPGRRMLVAVQCRRVHPIISFLRAHSEALEIVSYREL